MNKRFQGWSLGLLLASFLVAGCGEGAADHPAPRGVSALERIDEVVTAAEELLPDAQLFEISGSTVEARTFGGLCTNWSYRFYSAESHKLLTVTLSRDGLITVGEPEQPSADFFMTPLGLDSVNDSSAVLALLRDSAETDFFEGVEPLSESYHLGGVSSNWSVSLTGDNGEGFSTLTAVVSLGGEVLELREGEL